MFLNRLGTFLKNEAAIHHIFRVGTGLESQILLVISKS